MSQAVQRSCRHLGLAEDRGPFAEAEVGGDDDAGALLKLANRWENNALPEALRGRYPRSSRISR